MNASDSPSQHETLVLSYNQRAMGIAKTGDYGTALALLRHAEEVLYERRTPWRLRSLTLSNVGNVYRKTGETHLALHYLQQSLELLLTHRSDPVSVASTRLSLCAVYSAWGKHRQALNQALEALGTLRKSFDKAPKHVTTMAVAYYNAGLEHEHLKQLTAAAQKFTDGWHFAKQHLGQSHPLTAALRGCCSAAIDRQPVLETRLNATVSKVGTLFNPEALPVLPLRASQGFGKSPKDLAQTERSVHPRAYSGERSRLAALARAAQGEDPSDTQRPISRYIRSIGQKLGTLSSKLAQFEGDSKTLKSAISKPVVMTPASDLDDPRSHAIVDIQRLVRGFLARRRMQRDPVLAVEATARKAIGEVHRLRQELRRTKAVDLIQRCVRGFLARRRTLRLRTAVAIIQKNLKMYSVKSLYRKIRNAIVFIQAMYRGYRARFLCVAVSARLVSLVQLSRHGERTPRSSAPWALGETEPLSRLTARGAQQQLEHGRALRANYSQLLAKQYAPQRVYVRACDSQSTIASAEMQLKGAFEGQSGFKVETLADEHEVAMLPVYNCRRIKHLMNRDLLDSGRHLELMDRISDMEDFIRPYTAALDLWSVYNSSEIVANYLDRGLTPPCPGEATHLLELVYNHVHFNLYYGDKQQVRLGISPLLLEVLAKFEALLGGEEVAPVSLYVGEDVSLVPFLRAFEVQEIPGPGAFLQVELHAEDSGAFLRFRYNGNEFSLNRCPAPCSLAAFTEAWSKRMYQSLAKWEEKCEKLNPERPWPWKKTGIYAFAFVGLVLFIKMKEKVTEKFVQMFKRKKE